jgi:hypothetical protein
MNSRVLILYTPGSGGNFLGSIISSYLPNKQPPKWIIAPEGHMHECDSDGVSPMHCADLSLIPNIDSFKCKVAIRFDEDDIDVIARMHWNKLVVPTHKKMTNEIDPSWTFEDIRSFVVNWGKTTINDEVDHCFDFKSIFGVNGDINKEVSSYFGAPINDQVGEFIKKYQEINQKMYF